MDYIATTSDYERGLAVPRWAPLTATSSAAAAARMRQSDPDLYEDVMF